MHYDLLTRETCLRFYERQEKLKKWNRFFPFIIKPAVLSYMKKKEKKSYITALALIECDENYKKLSPSEKTKLIDDMLLTSAFFGLAPTGYNSYRFESKTKKERAEYYSMLELGYLVEQCRSPETYELLRNKAKTFDLIRPVTGRDAFFLKEASQLEECAAFLSRYRDVIVKPLNEYGGNGIQHIVVDEGKETETAEQLLQQGERLIEERVIQSEKMSWLNESSVNTLRVCSFRGINGIELLYVALRVGRKGSLVDNNHAGGLFINVDCDTHRTRNMKDSKPVPVFHPDSQKDLSDFEIPDWNGMLDTIEKAYTLLPKDEYLVGWDMAHTENGWVVIEVNSWPGANQVSEGGQAKRMRALFAPYLPKKPVRH